MHVKYFSWPHPLSLSFSHTRARTSTHTYPIPEAEGEIYGIYKAELIQALKTSWSNRQSNENVNEKMESSYKNYRKFKKEKG